MDFVDFKISIPAILRIKPNAIYKIGKYLRTSDFKNIVIFWGEGIKELFSKEISISLESSEINILKEEIVTKESIENLIEGAYKISNKCDAVIAIGGGKAIDFAKYTAFLNHLPIVSVPTAISNDGFCSPLSSLQVYGKKKTLKAKIPYGVIIDTNIIKNSPKKFIYSGIGDIISNVTAVRDWKIAAKMEKKAINDFAALIAMNGVENFINYANKDINDLELIKIISGALVLDGVAMEICNSSRPSSGSEHLISHAYDKLAEKPSLHGLQVGIATYCISYIQNNMHETIKKSLLDVGFMEFMSQNPLSKIDFIKAVNAANTIKENFYTILSTDENIDKLIDFIEKDEIMNKVLI